MGLESQKNHWARRDEGAFVGSAPGPSEHRWSWSRWMFRLKVSDTVFVFYFLFFFSIFLVFSSFCWGVWYLLDFFGFEMCCCILKVLLVLRLVCFAGIFQ